MSAAMRAPRQGARARVCACVCIKFDRRVSRHMLRYERGARFLRICISLVILITECFFHESRFICSLNYLEYKRIN